MHTQHSLITPSPPRRTINACQANSDGSRVCYLSSRSVYPASPKSIPLGDARPLPNGFTLLELAVVLIIIGLLAGAILVGRDLIEAARLRAQVSQVTQYQAAVRTFQVKYDAIPGDAPPSIANAFGMVPRSGDVGSGNDDEIIQSAGGYDSYLRFGGETALFWNDLATSELIPGSFSGNSDGLLTFPLSQRSQFLPDAKISADLSLAAVHNPYSHSNAYILLAGLSSVNGAYNLASKRLQTDPPLLFHATGVTPIQAFAIDTMIDDGVPNTGKVRGGSQFGGQGISILPHSAVAWTCLSGSGTAFAYNRSSVTLRDYPGCLMMFDWQ